MSFLAIVDGKFICECRDTWLSIAIGTWHNVHGESYTVMSYTIGDLYLTCSFIDRLFHGGCKTYYKFAALLKDSLELS